MPLVLGSAVEFDREAPSTPFPDMPERRLALLTSRCLVTGGGLFGDAGPELRLPEAGGLSSPFISPLALRYASECSEVGMAAPSVISLSKLTAILVFLTSSSISASVASSSSSGWSVMVTRGIQRFQSFHVSLLRRVRKTSDAGALINVRAETWNVAVDCGISGVENSVFVGAIAMAEEAGIGE